MACGACQFLRRRCDQTCQYAPYFSGDGMGIAQFGTIHKVFGARHLSKLLSQLPEDKRRDTVVTIFYEAESRLRNPIHGCCSNFIALQKEIMYWKEQLAVLKGELAAYGRLEEALPNSSQYINNHTTEYVNGMQPEIFNISSTNSPYEDNSLPWGNPQSISSQNGAVDNGDEKNELMEEHSDYLSGYLLDQDSMSSDMSNQTVSIDQQQIEMDVIRLGRLVRNDLR